MKFLLALLSSVHAHSWLACADYTEKNGAYYSHDKCRAYPRNGFMKVGGTFGADVGFDTQPGELGNPCKGSGDRNDATKYNANFPMAVYFKGQQVILAHPMKNHGADAKCTNVHIPDNGNFIYRGPKDDDNANHGRAYYHANLVADLGKSPTGNQNTASSTYPKPGFQNAPAFCEDTDKSMGTYSFNVPKDLEAGRYTFVWEWAFNGPTNVYSNCFEVDIVDTKEERDAIFDTRGAKGADKYVACGGITSNGGQGSTEGCDGGVVTLPPVTAAPSDTVPTVKPVKVGNVDAYQIAGEIVLPDYGSNIPDRRDIFVQFQCSNVSPHFWFAKFETIKYGGDDLIYVLHQTEAVDIARKKVGFHVSYDGEPCNMLMYPVTATVEDKYYNQIMAGMGISV